MGALKPVAKILPLQNLKNAIFKTIKMKGGKATVEKEDEVGGENQQPYDILKWGFGMVEYH